MTPENGNQILPARKVMLVPFLEIKAGNHITRENKNFCFNSPNLTVPSMEELYVLAFRAQLCRCILALKYSASLISV